MTYNLTTEFEQWLARTPNMRHVRQAIRDLEAVISDPMVLLSALLWLTLEWS